MEINRTILIADASEDFRSVLVEALRLEEGLDVVAQTGDGLEAIQLIREWKPDVLVMDLVLGRADGFDVLDSVRGIPRSTLILSSFARGCMADQVANRGGDYYMMKPCRISSVVERIRLLASKPWDEEGPDGEMTAMARQNLESSAARAKARRPQISPFPIPLPFPADPAFFPSVSLCVKKILCHTLFKSTRTRAGLMSKRGSG